MKNISLGCVVRHKKKTRAAHMFFQRLTTHPRGIFFHIKNNQLITLYILVQIQSISRHQISESKSHEICSCQDQNGESEKMLSRPATIFFLLTQCFLKAFFRVVKTKDCMVKN